MRKKNCLLACGLGLLLASCQTDLPVDGVTENGEGNVSFTVSAPEILQATRATLGDQSNSARGGITNVDFSEYDLRYQLAIYRIDGSDYVEAITPQMKVVDSYEPVTYSLRLTPNRTYQVVVWADFVKQGETTDLHYNTADFRDIRMASDKKASEYLNDESRDAYFISQKITVNDKGVTEDLTLKRPFAKIRVVATDWNYEKLEMPDNFKVSYYGCKRFVNLDAVLGVSSSDDLPASGNTVYTATINKDEKDYALNYDEGEHNRTILVDYLMTDKDEQTPIHFTLEALDGETPLMAHDLKTDIPIQRNWLTTIIGNLFTVGDNNFTVTIDEGFENEWSVGELWWNPEEIDPTEKPEYTESTKTYHIKTRNHFAWFTENIGKMKKEDLTGCTISIENDIDMSGTNWKPIYMEGEPAYTVEGNGHTLRNFTIDGQYAVKDHPVNLPIIGPKPVNAYIGVWATFDGKMQNLTFENISINGLADDEVHYDSDGNQIDHSDEDAWFAGCIGYVGANYSTPAIIDNVHAKHIHIEASGTNSITDLSAQNVGGLIGWIGVGGGVKPDETTQVKNCSAENVYITGYQTGGLVGEVKGGRGVGFTSCWTENVEIRIASMIFQNNAVSAFIGNIEGGNSVRISNCIPAKNLRLLDLNGKDSSYKPESEYYGDCESGTPVIETPNP